MFTIQFDKTDKSRYLRALKRTSKKVLSEKEEHPKRCAIEFQFIVLKNITSKKFSHAKSKSERYEKYKRNRVGHLDSWMLDGDLINAITYFRDGDGWMGGIPAGVKDSGDKSWLGPGRGRSLPIAEYANWLEFGRTGQPKRPVFVPTTKEYKAKGFVKQIEFTAKGIQKQWR
jgi:hypothetical protein